MRELPPLDPGWPLVTPRGVLALRVALAIRVHGWTEADCMEALGVSGGAVLRLRNRARLIASRVVARDFRGCVQCGRRLAVDAREDALRCLRPSTCRTRAFRARHKRNT